ncbi:MAG: peptidoglycan editing factor PgeF [Alphaproteobacteria bacterium]|nr:peptidoglycan editing factor PgeF [Alphaproteobacteria bacterium]
MPLQAKALSGVAHGFFGRNGGVSSGIFTSLNCGFGSSDDAVNVRENRSRVASWLGTQEPNVLTVYQIHSAEAVHVTAPWARGDAPKADGMATTMRGVALGVLAADCAPILFSDAEAGVIGAAHSGWKGAIGGIGEATVALMEKLGATRSRIRAAIGPCISQASYEVGPEFRERFVTASAAYARFFSAGARPSHWQFDLPGFVAQRLTVLGLASVEPLNACTYKHDSAYFSFRRTTHRGESDYGRNLSVIMLRS